MTIEQVANAFAARKSATCHNARTDGAEYRLHGHVIARHEGEGVVFDWCGWYTKTTAAHINEILRATGNHHCRVSYAKARDAGTTTFAV